MGLDGKASLPDMLMELDCFGLTLDIGDCLGVPTRDIAIEDQS